MGCGFILILFDIFFRFFWGIFRAGGEGEVAVMCASSFLLIVDFLC